MLFQIMDGGQQARSGMKVSMISLQKQKNRSFCNNTDLESAVMAKKVILPLGVMR